MLGYLRPLVDLIRPPRHNAHDVAGPIERRRYKGSESFFLYGMELILVFLVMYERGSEVPRSTL